MKNRKSLALLLLVPLLFSCTPENSLSSSDNITSSSLSEDSQSSSASSATSTTGGSSASESSSEFQTTSATTNPSSSLPEISYVQVFAPVSYTHVYAWIAGSPVNELVGAWPGTLLKSFDESWKTYDFQGYTAFQVIFNTGIGGNQTADLSVSAAGYYWLYQGGLVTENPLNGIDPTSSSESSEPLPPIEAASWQDFSMWNEYPQDHWTTINKYSGSRNDFRNESIYFTITTRFYDGDSANNVQAWDGARPEGDPAWRGDFKGLIERMDYIKALGFTAIWITPIVRNASGYDYHGYHAINFQMVDERYLSQDVDFQDVIDAAHSKDMKIVLDVVFNHTGNFGEENIFPMFTKSGDLSLFSSMKKLPNAPLPANYDMLSSGEQYNARIASMKNTRNDGSDPNYIYHHYGNFSWETFGEQVAQIAGDCVDLNTENPRVAEYIVKSYGTFIRMGVDAFRIDTMKHISRLTFNNYIFPAMYEYARRCGNTGFHMFGEVATRVREVWNRNIPALSAPFFTWKEEKAYPWGDTATNLTSIEQAYNDNKEVSNERTSSNAYLNGVSYHTPDYTRSSRVGVIDFPMHWNFQYARDSFNLAKGTDQYYNDATYNVMYVDSHDYAPDGIEKTRYIMGTDAWAENMSLMFTFRGIPCIYYGSEIEFQKGKTIDEGPNILLANSGRAYYGAHLAGTINATGFGDYNATGTVATTLDSTLSKHLIKLNKIRQSVPALSMGQYTTNNVSGSMAYIRRYTVGTIDSLALVTVSGGATFSSIPNGTYVDVVTGDVKVVSTGSLSTSSIGMGNLRVYVLQNSYTGTVTKIGATTTYLK